MLTESVRMLLRRWLLCVLALILAACAGVATFSVVKPVQESKAQVLFVGSVAQPGVDGPTNPLINLGGSLAVVASVVQVVVSDASVVQELYKQNATAKYVVEPNLAENAGPTLLITTDDKSGQVAQQTLSAVIDEINKQLVKIQADRNVQPNLYITTITLTKSAHSLPVRKGQVQKAIIAGIGVAVVLILLILLLERRRMTKSARSRAAQPVETLEPVEPAEPAWGAQGVRSAQAAEPGQADQPRQAPQYADPAPPRAAREPDQPQTRSESGQPTRRHNRDNPERTRAAARSEAQAARQERRSRRRDAREEDIDSDGSILPGGLTAGSPSDSARR
jgi:capsular polysaccharide biosynthesis protein